MKSAFVILNLLFTVQLTMAQIFVVTESKKCYSFDNRKIRKGDTLEIMSGFSLERKGKIKLLHANEWYSAYSDPGNYKIDTLFAKLKTTREYVVHDSIFNILKGLNILHCKVHNTLNCKPMFGTGLSADEKRERYPIETVDSSIKIKWNHPVNYKGNYYILVTNVFEDYVDIKVTHDITFDLNLIPYKPQRAILYKVISEQCWESDTKVIIMKR